MSDKQQFETVTDEELKRIVNGFNARINSLGIKKNSKTFYREQATFMSGALTALGKVHQGLMIVVGTRRSVIEEYKSIIQ